MKRSSLSKTNFRKRLLLTGCSAAAMIITDAALAQDEIIVSATKREESIQDVPLAISAYSGEFVRETNLDDVKDLVKFTPGVSGNSFDSFIDFINVRGIRVIWRQFYMSHELACP